jgi:acetyl-CoA carboxylase carboxyl transferase beta subunit
MGIIEQFKIRKKNNSGKKVKLEKKESPKNLYSKCPVCQQAFHVSELMQQYNVCPDCGYHMRMTAYERVNMIMDEGSFREFSKYKGGKNPLSFPGYSEKLKAVQDKSGLREAVVTGYGTIDEQKVVICVMDANFMMGSMGSVVGEKITIAIERATRLKQPLIIFSTSGGARMQEGMYSLMQMTKTAAALQKHHEKGHLYISVLTHPTTGGVTASFASIGDIILAEPEALIGFAGPRVIEETIKSKLPEGFQKSEFLLEHGFVDRIVKRDNMKEELSLLIRLHQGDK